MSCDGSSVEPRDGSSDRAPAPFAQPPAAGGGAGGLRGVRLCRAEDASWTRHTPGGCWAPFSRAQSRGLRELVPGETVALESEHADQDGFHYRANTARPRQGSGPKRRRALRQFGGRLGDDTAR